MNAFLHRIENARQDGLNAGVAIGFQMAADAVYYAAGDPEGHRDDVYSECRTDLLF